MKVIDVMTHGGLSCKAGDTLHDATQKMVMRRCGSLPVVDDDGKLIGIITIRDTMLPLYPNFGEYIHDAKYARDFEEMEDNYKKVMCMKVKEVMTPDPMTVSSDTPVLKASTGACSSSTAEPVVTRHLQQAPVFRSLFCFGPA